MPEDLPGIVYPSLLLSPEGSYDRSGAVSPTASAGTTVVAGQYGQAWQCEAIASAVTLPVAGRVTPKKGEALVRAAIGTFSGSGFHIPVEIGTFGDGSFFRLYVNDAVRGYQRWSPDPGLTTTAAAIPPPPTAVFKTYRMRWDEQSFVIEMAGIDRAPVASITPRGAAFNGTVSLGGNTNNITTVEAVLLYPEPIPDSEWERIAAIPGRWTMQNTAVNTSPRPIFPVRKLGTPHIGPLRVGKD